MLALILGLSLLTWAASGVVQSTVREWFERDVQSRSHLVLIGARPALADAWYDSANLNKQLVTLTLDAHVMGVAACGADFSTRSITPGFPQEFSCLAVGPRIRESGSSATQPGEATPEWTTEATLPTGAFWSPRCPSPSMDRTSALPFWYTISVTSSAAR